MKKFAALLLAMLLVLTMTVGSAMAEITVGIVNNPPSESGYREANVKDFEAVFSAENGYTAKTYYSLKNDEQLAAAQQFITDGVDYLLISAAETTGWDAVLTSAQENGIPVFLFDRMIACDESLYEAAVVSDMANQGKLAVEWLIAQNLEAYNIIHIQGAMGSDAQIGRTGALDEQVKTRSKQNRKNQDGKIKSGEPQQSASWQPLVFLSGFLSTAFLTQNGAMPTNRSPGKPPESASMKQKHTGKPLPVTPEWNYAHTATRSAA